MLFDNLPVNMYVLCKHLYETDEHTRLVIYYTSKN